MVKDYRGECGPEWRARKGGLRERVQSEGGLPCWGRISRIGKNMAGPEKGSKCAQANGVHSWVWEVPSAVFWERKETACSLRGLEERLLAFCFREETEADAKAEVEGLGVGTQAVLGGRTE